MLVFIKCKVIASDQSQPYAKFQLQPENFSVRDRGMLPFKCIPCTCLFIAGTVSLTSLRAQKIVDDKLLLRAEFQVKAAHKKPGSIKWLPEDDAYEGVVLVVPFTSEFFMQLL